MHMEAPLDTIGSRMLKEGKHEKNEPRELDGRDMGKAGGQRKQRRGDQPVY